MKLYKTITLITLLLYTSLQANQSTNKIEDDLYIGIGIGISNSSVDSPFIENDISYPNISIMAGYKYTDFLSFESRYWYDFNSVLIQIDEKTMNTNLNTFALYFKPNLELSEKSSIYGLIGGSLTTPDLISPSYGFGFSFKTSKDTSFFIDYIKILHTIETLTLDNQNYSNTKYIDNINSGIMFKF